VSYRSGCVAISASVVISYPIERKRSTVSAFVDVPRLVGNLYEPCLPLTAAIESFLGFRGSAVELLLGIDRLDQMIDRRDQVMKRLPLNGIFT